MKPLFRSIPILILLWPQLALTQQDSTHTFGNDPREPEYFFGFNLMPNALGGLYHLVLIKPQRNGTRIIKQITKESFIAQASGKETSQANPEGIDFFNKFEINNPDILEDLWKLRYKSYPYRTHDPVDPGWSTNDSIPFIPSPGQMRTLENFGMYRMSDYIFGDNAFRLLQLISKPEWVKLYKESY